jgi:transcriptional regulator of acetoin/glycerol metabolism
MADRDKIPEEILRIGKKTGGTPVDEVVTLEEMDKRMIAESLDKNRGNLSQVSRELGITRATLYRKMNKFGL